MIPLCVFVTTVSAGVANRAVIWYITAMIALRVWPDSR